MIHSMEGNSFLDNHFILFNSVSSIRRVGV